MNPTNAWRLVLLAVASGVVTWVVEQWVTGGGSTSFVPALASSITLVLLGGAAIVIAWPVRRYTAAMRRALAAERAGAADATAKLRDASTARPEPARARLALAFAKASSMAGALFVGTSAAVLLWLLTRTVVGGQLPEAIIAVVASAVLVACGLLAESWCRLPPEDSDRLAAAEPSTA